MNTGNAFLKVMTEAATDRQKVPLLVWCQRTPNPFGGFCTSHADCRASHWVEIDKEDARLAARAKASRPKVRPA